jgi:hypothetical protein
MNDMASTPSDSVPHPAAHNLVATYETPEQARAALQMLERKGLDGGAIELFGPGVAAAKGPVTGVRQGQTDMEATKAVGKRFSAVSAVVAVFGAVVGGLLGLVIGGHGTEILVGALGGFIVGGLLGFVWGGFSALSVNEQWEETFDPATGETSVAVHSEDPAEIETAVEALRGSAARRLATCGPDGTLRDVA